MISSKIQRRYLSDVLFLSKSINSILIAFHFFLIAIAVYCPNLYLICKKTHLYQIDPKRLNSFTLVCTNEMNLSSRVLNLSSVKRTIFKLQILETFISTNFDFNMNLPLATVFVSLLCVIVSKIIKNP